MSDLQARLMEAFQTEYREHVACIRTALTEENQTGGENSSLDETFRRAHSLKGAARAVGLASVERVAHALESLFAKMREGTVGLSPELCRAIEAGLSAIEDEVAFASGHVRVPPDSDAARAALESAASELEYAEGAPGRANRSGASKQNPRAENDPTAAAAAGVGEARSPPMDSVRIPIEHLDGLLRGAERLRAESLAQASAGVSLDAVRGELTALHREWDALRTDTSLPIRRLRERPEFKSVVRFLESFGQRVHGAGRRTQAVQRTWRGGAMRLHRLASDLQSSIGQARMVPARSVFEDFAPTFRELARGAGKSARLETSGLDAVADRRVLQSLKDPVMHLLRNCVSHGIEPPTEREAAGKPAEGTVRLELAVNAGRLVVEVRDDGRGLDLAAVQAAATGRGGDPSPVSGSVDEIELAQEVFTPGLSTAGTVSELSGRGIGLSVVREAARALQGEARVTGWGAGGFAVCLEVPASVTLQQLLMVRAGTHRYALPTHAVAGVRRLEPEQIGTMEGVPVIAYGDRRVPIASLAGLVHDADAGVRSETGRVAVAVVRSAELELALAVDALDGELDAMVRPLEIESRGASECCAGVILLEGGDVVVVLNPSGLFERFRSSRGHYFAIHEASSGVSPVPLILVVDDSFTTRTLEKSLLEAHGYRVSVAEDGLEALNRIREDRPDLVLTDIEMPRLDGFGLIEAVKRDPSLSSTPVVIVSSNDDPGSRRRGLDLGADAFVVKRGFDQHSLLATLRQLL